MKVPDSLENEGCLKSSSNHDLSNLNTRGYKHHYSLQYTLNSSIYSLFYEFFHTHCRETSLPQNEPYHGAEDGEGN